FALRARSAQDGVEDQVDPRGRDGRLDRALDVARLAGARLAVAVDVGAQEHGPLEAGALDHHVALVELELHRQLAELELVDRDRRAERLAGGRVDRPGAEEDDRALHQARRAGGVAGRADAAAQELALVDRAVRVGRLEAGHLHVEAGVRIARAAHVEPGVRIARAAHVEPGVRIARAAHVEPGVRIARAHVEPGVRIARAAHVEPGVRIAAARAAARRGADPARRRLRRLPPVRRRQRAGRAAALAAE